MLRLILSFAGVAFIGLGLFGDNALKNFMANVSGQAEHLPRAEAASDQSVVVIDNDLSPEASAVPEVSATKQVVAADTSVTPVVTPVAEEKIEAVAVEIAEQPAVAEVTPEPQVIPLETATGSQVALQTDGAEPMAPAQAAGDLIAMAEQAKSSSRNEQVNIAKTIVAAAAQPVAQSVPVEVSKTEEVSSVMVSAAGEISNDLLIVVKDKVNLRDGPSIDHPIVMLLAQGQELMEFKREGKWVHVGAYGTSGKIGWVHQRLVGQPPAQ